MIKKEHTLGHCTMMVADYCSPSTSSSTITQESSLKNLCSIKSSSTPVKVNIPPEYQKFVMHFKNKLSADLLAAHGNLLLTGSIIEIMPLHRSFDVKDWGDQVKQKAKYFMDQALTSELEVNPLLTNSICNHLNGMQIIHPDLYYTISPDSVLKVSGCKLTVHKAIQQMKDLQFDAVGINYSIEMLPKHVEYIMKFAEKEVTAVHSSVVMKTLPNVPSYLNISCIDQMVFDNVKTIINKKLLEACVEKIVLTVSAYSLLSDARGRQNVAKALLYVQEHILYDYEISDCQLIIYSPSFSYCLIAKQAISQLTVEMKIALGSFHTLNCFSKSGWNDLIQHLQSDYFISICVNDDSVLLTGKEEVFHVVSAALLEFLDVEVIVEKVVVNRDAWQVVKSTNEFEEVLKSAEKVGVNVTFPNNFGHEDVVITLLGYSVIVDPLKKKLLLLCDQVIMMEVRAPSLLSISEAEAVISKCQELKKDVLITYSISESFFCNTSKVDDVGKCCILNATCSNGAKVLVYYGDAMKKACNAMAVFVSELPRARNYGILSSLVEAGGSDVFNDIETLKDKNLLPATVHKSQNVGNLSCSEIYYVVLPHFNDRSEKTVTAALQELFSQLSYNEILITSFTDVPLNYPVDVYAHVLLSCIAKMRLNEDLTITVFVDEKKHASTFRKELLKLGYELHNSSLLMDVNHPLSIVQISNENLFNLEVYVNKK